MSSHEEDIDLTIITEMFRKQKAHMLYHLNGSDLRKKFRTIRFALAGRLETSAGKIVGFERYLFGGKGGKIETIEFLSSDGFETVCGIVTYDGSSPKDTRYFKEPMSPGGMADDLASAVAVREGYMGHVAMAMNLASLAMTLLSLSFVGKWVYDRVIAYRDESHARTNSEMRLNEFLFKGQTGREAVFSKYETMVTYVRNLIAGRGHGVIIYGGPGTGKSLMVRRTLHFAGLKPGKDYVIVKGSSAKDEDNIKIVYSTLYENNGKIIVFDDFDSALRDRSVINLLKAALDSYPVRVVSMPDLTAYTAEGPPLPGRFEFTGRIIMITNLPEIDTALMSRTNSVAINFTAEEFRQNIETNLSFLSPEVDMSVKQEVFDHLRDMIATNPKVELDFRRFTSMIDLRLAYPESWKELSNNLLYPRK